MVLFQGLLSFKTSSYESDEEAEKRASALQLL